MMAVNLFEHLWVSPGPEYPQLHFCQAGDLTWGAESPFGVSFNSLAWSEGKHNIAEVTDTPLSSTILFGWELSPFLRFHLPNFVSVHRSSVL